MLKIFLSYSRTDQSSAMHLARDFSSLEHKVWLDKELTGGQAWWDKILSQIRECDLFVVALSNSYSNSQACRLEYQYAYDLRKRILPLKIEDNVSLNILPSTLTSLQIVDYKEDSKASFLSLVKAISNLPPSQPLPNPLPQSPEVPISYLDQLKDQIDSSNDLSMASQLEIIAKLKGRLDIPSEKKDAIYLLQRLRKRNDLFTRASEQIDQILMKSKIEPQESSSRMQRPIPQSQPMTHQPVATTPKKEESEGGSSFFEIIGYIVVGFFVLALVSGGC
ncbi:MAG: toll/interleukin-1 receptor domain-containing protein [Haliscomenobacteraceae bacterium CHB4]|nr:hypothetical protein [Saprospiraceae bacterium]MCE7926484.1 toll/interleukin-1 receptor domain-containing protein [Haliscomenobacteraceae bacterium CHB4]